jgi:acyl transferase domain-containing protein/acyl carrier protein
MREDYDDQLERAARVVASLRKRLAEVERPNAEAIAVVGMACRFPGEARDCDSFWRMILQGRDAIRANLALRAREVGGDALRPVALLDDIETFDAAFFDISPREAVQMDPQQRLFLEVAWEALEDAGRTRASLAGSQTGVFVGVHNHSNGYLELQTANTARCNEYTAIGSGHDVIAGRLAYVFDLRGPCLAINTACSSSLVAIHTACQSLRSRDCGVAVAGGVNLILGSMQSRIVSMGAMLARDGRCKSFDARADGYGRGEGCGVVVLKRLSDATAARDRILAVIRGSAINQDGRTNGLTAPSGLAQQDLIRRALANADMEASRVGYVETHGTGTALGDPIEVEALASVYGAQREGVPLCALGSAKANINHLEGAAGVAGLIKAILALRAGILPPVAGFKQLNPHLSLADTRLFIPTEPLEWSSAGPRVAAVSAFGWSGVNAHVLLEEAPADAPSTPARPTMTLVSAPDPATLSMRAMALAEALETLPDEALESFAWTVTTRRSHYPCCLAVAARDRAEMIAKLRQASQRSPALPQATPKIAYLIGDEDGDVGTYGSELIKSEEVFRRVVSECAAAFGAIGDSATASALTTGFENAPGRARSFAFAIAVAAMLKHWGVRPDAVVGDGLGAIAAACISEERTLEDAARLIRGQERRAAPARTVEGLSPARMDLTIRLDRLTLENAADADGGSARLGMMRILAGVAAAGVTLDWDAIFAPTCRLVSLPAHPWRRRRHWIEEPAPVAHPLEEQPVQELHAPDDWFFETVWRPSQAEARSSPADTRRWLVLGQADGPADQLAGWIRRQNGVATVESRSGSDLALALAAGREDRWIVDLRALDRRSGDKAAEAGRLARQLNDLDRALNHAPSGFGAKLWAVTRGAQNVLGNEEPDLPGASLWGLVRSLILDQRKRWGGLIDVESGTLFDPELLFTEIASGSDEPDEVGFRKGLRYVNRLVRANPPPIRKLRLDPAATYLVLGAFGGVGPALAECLVRHGAKSLVLAGRSIGDGPDPDHPSAALRRRLTAMGASARIERCDVGDRGSVAGLFERLRDGRSPLKGLFLAAAAAALPVNAIGDSDIAAAFRPKVEGGVLIDAYSRGFDLDFFVLFSSAAGVLGARGQGHYAAANAVLDALAASRRAQGLPALSIAWGLWDAEGAAHVPYFQRAGLEPMQPAAALDAMVRLASSSDRGQADAMVAALDGDRLSVALEARGRARFLSRLTSKSAVPSSDQTRALMEQLRQAPVGLLRTMIADVVARNVRSVMELAPDDPLNADRGFFDLGMDSLMTVALKARLEDEFGVSLSSTLAMDYPSVSALAGYFEALVAGPSAAIGTNDFRVALAPEAAKIENAQSVASLSDDEVGEALESELKSLELESLA